MNGTHDCHLGRGSLRFGSEALLPSEGAALLRQGLRCQIIALEDLLERVVLGFRRCFVHRQIDPSSKPTFAAKLAPGEPEPATGRLKPGGAASASSPATSGPSSSTSFGHCWIEGDDWLRSQPATVSVRRPQRSARSRCLTPSSSRLARSRSPRCRCTSEKAQ